MKKKIAIFCQVDEEKQSISHLHQLFTCFSPYFYVRFFVHIDHMKSPLPPYMPVVAYCDAMDSKANVQEDEETFELTSFRVYEPDFVYFVNFPQWNEHIAKLHSLKPDPVYLLDACLDKNLMNDISEGLAALEKIHSVIVPENFPVHADVARHGARVIFFEDMCRDLSLVLTAVFGYASSQATDCITESRLGMFPASQTTHSPLKILYVLYTLAKGKGGAERVAVELANEMLRRGHYSSMIYQEAGLTSLPSYPCDGDVVLIPFSEKDDLRKMITTINPSVIMYFTLNRSIIEFCKTISDVTIPLCLQECSNPQRMIANNWRIDRMIPKKAAWEREIVASRAVRIRMIQKQYRESFPPYLRGQVRAFVNPADGKSNRADPAGENEPQKRILLVNGFKATKNLITLLRAFELLKMDFPDWNLQLVGKIPETLDLALHREIFSFIEQHDIERRIEFVGATNDIFPYYVNSHIHAITSLSEGCPLVVLEAMSVGLPTVGFEDCTGTNILVSHGRNGLLASSFNRVQSLADTLRELMASPALRSALGAQALEDAKEFEPSKVYDQWEDLFIEAASYGARPSRLFEEQASVDYELALHAKRMRKKLLGYPY